MKMFSWVLITWITIVLGLSAAVLQDVVGDVRNISVTVLAMEDEDEEDERAMIFEDEPMLKLNVSWLPPDTGRRPSFYSVSITSVPTNSTSCLEGSIYYVGRNVNQTSVLLPENRFPDVVLADRTAAAAALDELEIEPGCAYRVQVFANPRNNLGAPPSTVYTVPECVGGRCSCDTALNTLPIPVINSRVLHNGSLQITWHVDDSPKRTAAVESYKVSVGIPHLTSSSGLVVYNKTVIFTGTANDNSFIWNEQNLKKGTKIFVTAQDSNGCSGREGSYTTKRLRHYPFYHKNVTAFVLTGLVSLFLLASGIVSVVGYLKRHQHYKALLIENKSPKQLASVLQNPRIEALLKNHNILYIDQEIEEAKSKDLADEHEISYRRLRLERELGQGQFGQVYLAHLLPPGQDAMISDEEGTLVAVKMSSDTARAQLEVRQQLLEEIAIMKVAGLHPHLVGLVGCCTLSANPVCLVLEYMRGGDLLGYLHRMRDAALAETCNVSNCDSSLESPGVTSAKTISTSLGSLSPSTPTSRVFFANNFKPEDVDTVEGAISHAEMMRFALEIAKGMEHLETKGIVHRDLAARNVLMDEHLVLKISDFGLSRKGTYMLNGGGTRRLPIRWMPPEAIRRRAFTSKSDIWSYGVVLWEIASLGDFPYSHIADADLLKHLLEENGRPELTTDEVAAAPGEMREMMEMCWASQPERRPNFKQVVMWLENKRERARGCCKNNLMYQDVVQDEVESLGV